MAMARESKSIAVMPSDAPRLRINQPDDTYEREADRMADGVVASPARKAAWSLSRVTMGPGILPRELGAGKQPGATAWIPVAQAAARYSVARKRSLMGGGSRSELRFRVPTGADLTKLWNSHTISEDVFKDRVKTALRRMSSESALDPRWSSPDELIARIFPQPGVFDQTEFESIIKMANRGDVYKSVLEAETKIDSGDKPRFLKAIDASIATIQQAEGNDKELTKVFGTKKDTAKDNYKKARGALATLQGTLDTNVTTDYNADDRQVGLGGWAMFSQQRAHFQPEVVKATNFEESEATIIHEGSHLSNDTVDDKGYYGNPTYDSALEEVKVTNAAHYEEVPRRILKHSRYADKDHPGEFLTFVPGQAKGGGNVSFDDKARSEAVEYLRKAWDAAVDVDQLVRGVRVDEVAAGRTDLGKDRAKLTEISKVMGLTIHEQKDQKAAEVNQLDMVLVEGVPHAILALQRAVRRAKVPNPVQMVQVSPQERGGAGEHDAPPGRQRVVMDPETAGKMMVEETLTDTSTALTQTRDKDVILLQWLVDHYKQVF